MTRAHSGRAVVAQGSRAHRHTDQSPGAMLVAALTAPDADAAICTVENDALLNGSADGVLPGIRRLPALRRSERPADLDRVATETCAMVEESGGSCDGIVTHPRLYREMLRRGAARGVRVCRTGMVPAHEAIFADFGAAFTLLDTLDSAIGLRRGAGTDGQDLLWASVDIGLAVHLPHQVVVRRVAELRPPHRSAP